MSDDAQEREAAAESAERRAYGRWLFAQECRFVIGAVDAAQVPDLELPEVAFAGRSNVGKSSLVNALTGRKTLARTSSTPGRTQQLNFFDLGGRLILVDLPGYGYHKAGKTAGKRWSRLAQDYLKGRVMLRLACLLVDARHGLKDSDRTVMQDLDGAAVAYRVVLTKADKVKPDALAARVGEVEEELKRHPAAQPQVQTTSALTGAGIEELRGELAALAKDAG
ncbi:MAG: ribosome biogenesis GTP-binding protein YihA/YsxC [Rhodovibrionaceae bacterium]|nr:ribosome biogenesis GTP-binding protein YihA/YsxC [Rhodovibrionaceae bacterium]